ncbi:MAG TPA: CvpA family protein [Candidatus Caccalectryoclostridium excrementigallinarum]|uniref:CvpA family protein n=1 Tax=Candidatus Caccalectryoclostridium excrementigallinarum TaxID=2840710 RepID=A0A9D1MMU5_9FIRM|nr:CvpA family protein [Candidatus Caccalectryoclostridium excrementigallinarum]
MFLLCQISAISIAGFVILGLFVLLGLWKGAIRMLLDLLVIGLSVAAGALAVKPIRNALAEQDYFGLEWLESILSGNLAFIVVGFATLIVLLIIKAIIMHFVDKKGGKVKGALQVVNKLAGAVLGGGIGFLAFGFVLLCYVSVITVLKYEGDMDAAVASLDSVSSWMMENNVFQKIVDALTQVKDSIVDAAAGAALLS